MLLRFETHLQLDLVEHGEQHRGRARDPAVRDAEVAAVAMEAVRAHLKPVAGLAHEEADREQRILFDRVPVLHDLLGGIGRGPLEDLAVAFAHEVVASHLHVEARPTIAQHRAGGDRLVLMSASPDLYVPRIAALLGFDECICTRVRWRGPILDGRLDGPNCRGAEKSHHLQQLRARHPGTPVIAYGNSAGDLDHLRRCEAAVYVNAGRREGATLASEGIRLVRWQ